VRADSVTKGFKGADHSLPAALRILSRIVFAGQHRAHDIRGTHVGAVVYLGSALWVPDSIGCWF
jgi:hypothetical protein